MQCLDTQSATDGAPQSLKELVDQVRNAKRARFFYSNRFQEWIMLLADNKAKRAVHRFYGKGVSVYTLDEIEKISQLPEEARADVNEWIRELGCFVDEVSTNP